VATNEAGATRNDGTSRRVRPHQANNRIS
jgi:hypothetical protein